MDDYKVSMKSGLEDRNNARAVETVRRGSGVSMKSGLEDRNNSGTPKSPVSRGSVSMKSGLEDRNNVPREGAVVTGFGSQ